MTAIDVGDDDHSPHLPPGSDVERCDACGYRWPCPTVRSGPRRLDAAEWELLRSLDVRVGFTLWRRAPEGAEDREPYGGTVVGVYDDDGATVFRLRSLSRGRPREGRLRLADVEPATVGLPNAVFVRSLVRGLAGWVSKQKGMATGEELEVLADAFTLYREVA